MQFNNTVFLKLAQQVHMELKKASVMSIKWQMLKPVMKLAEVWLTNGLTSCSENEADIQGK